MVVKGSKLTLEHRRKISEAMHNSEKWHESVRNRKKREKANRLKGRHRKSVSHPRHTSVAESLRVKAEEKRLGVHCILITAARMKRLVRESPTHQILCGHRQCNGLLRVGDIVVPRGNQRYGKRKHRKRYYHTWCWESLFIDVED